MPVVAVAMHVAVTMTGADANAAFTHTHGHVRLRSSRRGERRRSEQKPRGSRESQNELGHLISP
jgi:hypothetical protein